MSDVAGTVQQLFLTYQKNLPLMLSACKTDEQHDQVIDKYVAARDAYYDCVGKAFQQNDASLKTLLTQATTVTASLNTIGAHLGEIAKIIGYATQAATVAGGIATMGA